MDDIRIGEVARRVGVSPSTLRAWERKGLVRPDRAGGRHRRYTSEDIARLRDVRALLTQGYAPPALHSLMAGEVIPEDSVVGKRLRAARTRRGLSLRDAAERAGISASYLSLVERGLAEPSVSLLQRVASAYGGTLLEFFGASPPGTAGPKLVRTNERRRLRGFDRVEIEDLVTFPDAVLEINIFSVAPGGGSGGAYAHDGEEAVYVLSGALDIWLDETEHYHVEPGDTLYFRSAQRHRWTNHSSDTTRLFWVNTPPTF
ncbi:MAG TPA: MerR family transcriptional regulator [Candidatus Saccharimonadales bacterium]|nr:MerR family transcriptional regulator [Candidatus Saccharimonadales bacterium]